MLINKERTLTEKVLERGTLNGRIGQGVYKFPKSIDSLVYLSCLMILDPEFQSRPNRQMLMDGKMGYVGVGVVEDAAFVYVTVVVAEDFEDKKGAEWAEKKVVLKKENIAALEKDKERFSELFKGAEDEDGFEQKEKSDGTDNARNPNASKDLSLPSEDNYEIDENDRRKSVERAQPPIEKERYKSETNETSEEEGTNNNESVRELKSRAEDKDSNEENYQKSVASNKKEISEDYSGNMYSEDDFGDGDYDSSSELGYFDDDDDDMNTGLAVKSAQSLHKKGLSQKIKHKEMLKHETSKKEHGSGENSAASRVIHRKSNLKRFEHLLDTINELKDSLVKH